MVTKLWSDKATYEGCNTSKGYEASEPLFQPYYTSGKAMKQIGFLSRNLHDCSKTLKELSYKQFVLPILEYASSIWDPYH